MDASTLELLQPIIASLLGVIVGSSLTYILNTLNEKRKEQRQDKANTALLNMEIRKNIKILQTFCQKINKKNRRYEPITKHTLAEVLSYSDFIEWSKDIWDENNPSLIMALSNNKIDKIENFYENLELISSLQREIVSLRKKIHEEKSKPQPTYAQEDIDKTVKELSTNFQKKFEDFKKIALETIKEGESIKKILK